MPIRAAQRPKLPVPAPASPSVLPIYLALFAVTLLVYARSATFDFINFDDPDYTGRPLSFPNLIWALTSHDAANWFPVTRLTHLIDFTLFGAQAGPAHLINALLHTAAALLLFAFLFRATAARWPSAFVAFLFALHPLHVESVAWIAERKDVLSACFGFLSLWAYVANRRALSLVAFALGLMSKSMLVTLPALLLLIDYWPLQRFRGWAAELRDKAVYFALAIAAGAITLFAQQSSGAIRTIESFPLGLRFANALVTCCVYIAQLFAPVNLAVFYPYPTNIPAWQPTLAAIALGAVTTLVWRARHSRPSLLTGWLWFIITLLPVIGIIQVGAQAHADRYMYIPMVGLAIMLAWGAADLLPQQPKPLAVLGAVALVACALITWNQLSYWQNSETLFQHAIDVTPANYLAEHNLGSYLLDKPGRLSDAAIHLRAALDLRPDYPQAQTDLATALAQSPGGLPQAISLYQSAQRILPDSPVIRDNLAKAEYSYGLSLLKQGAPADSIPHFQSSLALSPANPEAENNLGTAYAQTGHLAEAEKHFRQAIHLQPNYADAHLNLGVTLANANRPAEALPELETADRLQPDPQVERDIETLRRSIKR